MGYIFSRTRLIAKPLGDGRRSRRSQAIADDSYSTMGISLITQHHYKGDLTAGPSDRTPDPAHRTRYGGYWVCSAVSRILESGPRQWRRRPVGHPAVTAGTTAGLSAAPPAMGPAAAALTLWLAAKAAAATLPPSAFLVRPADWSFTDGEAPADEVLDTTTGQTECE